MVTTATLVAIKWTVGYIIHGIKALADVISITEEIDEHLKKN
jgi:hypothetical protein